MTKGGTSAPEGFTTGSETYDDAVRHNSAGSERLVMSLPAGDYRTALDVGCGTGWTSAALVRRFGVETIVGVDASEGMLERFAAKLGSAFPDVAVELRNEDVMAMDVPDGGFEVVLCAMALHWFPDKTGAVARMARALRPGGVMGILMVGRGGENSWRELLERVDAPAEWTEWFEVNRRDVDEIDGDLRAASLEPLDVWMERRRRRTPPDEFMARTRSVAAHLLGNSPGELSDLDRRIERALHDAAGPEGFEYDYCKLYAVARKPRRPPGPARSRRWERANQRGVLALPESRGQLRSARARHEEGPSGSSPWVYETTGRGFEALCGTSQEVAGGKDFTDASRSPARSQTFMASGAPEYDS